MDRKHLLTIIILVGFLILSTLVGKILVGTLEFIALSTSPVGGITKVLSIAALILAGIGYITEKTKKKNTTEK